MTSDDKRRYRVQTPADSSLKNPSGSLPTGTIGGESIPFFPSALFAKAALARFSALSVDRVKLIVYTLSGLASGLAAWVLVSRVTTTRMDMGSGYELDVIAAVVLGGTSIFGGSGTIWGTVIGLAMIQLLKNEIGRAHV